MLSRILNALVLSIGLMGAVNASTTTHQCVVDSWPLWSEFKSHFLTQQGRVIYSFSPKSDTVSEGQSYAMFFALVANDPDSFDVIWRWTMSNLFAGDLDNNLPAWLWGKNDAGEWKVLDPHSASDADLWFAYTLLEAGRLWSRADYIIDANKILAAIEKHEIADLPDFGKMLLPGKVSFTPPEDLWRINPSYLPIPLLRLFTSQRPEGPWDEIARNTPRMLAEVSPKGFAPDWVSYQQFPDGKSRFVKDEIGGDTSSYDAIRVYLWAGMTPKSDPLSLPMLQALPGMLKVLNETGIPPEKVNVMTGQTNGNGPFGYSAALLPYLSALGARQQLETQEHRARVMLAAMQIDKTLYEERPPYYDYALSLFGLGWMEKRYQFMKNGQVKFNWEKSCF